jgi:hypothetical protein
MIGADFNARLGTRAEYSIDEERTKDHLIVPDGVHEIIDRGIQYINSQ